MGKTKPSHLPRRCLKTTTTETESTTATAILIKTSEKHREAPTAPRFRAPFSLRMPVA